MYVCVCVCIHARCIVPTMLYWFNISSHIFIWQNRYTCTCIA